PPSFPTWPNLRRWRPKCGPPGSPWGPGPSSWPAPVSTPWASSPPDGGGGGHPPTASRKRQGDGVSQPGGRDRHGERDLFARRLGALASPCPALSRPAGEGASRAGGRCGQRGGREDPPAGPRARPPPAVARLPVTQKKTPKNTGKIGSV